MNDLRCDVCDSLMEPKSLETVTRCPSCGFYRSRLPLRINSIERIDEVARERALKVLRQENFNQLLDACSSFVRPGGTVLDVGCAHGWFLDALQARGFSATGMEPDKAMADAARAAGHIVLSGFFPADFPKGRLFDAITFNDVFEHLPDLPGTLRGLDGALAPNGHVIVNLPLSDGAIFRMAQVAYRFGITQPLQRMWQVGLPSPHLSYFSRDTLPRLFSRFGFELVKEGRLTSVVTRGLFQRIRYDTQVGLGRAALVYAVALGLRPLLRILPPDIGYFVFRRRMT